ncbi:ABC transporter ATP-binding protein [Pseudomonas sp. 5P_3.1_Bac2]|uniref:ABC transporter ATP-binding protein n=1 Tax=Pseudomonas sp. 5P_3.1_Bac2 TaxID=2971617 RepID=UPI0021C6E4F1|nr:ABC transporter ATP-binding protein [Pseudomonas sp. 5P_3.1_Bac2]MCU1717151.1 ABC transporter ATP-binding protein/permease [Pseudomonas sp. 5P_3.1_Bac2]
MSKDEQVAATASSLKQVLRPIRQRLGLAAALAALGAMLTLVPLAAITQLAQQALTHWQAGAGPWQAQQLWPLLSVSLVSLFLGMGLQTLGESQAHLADNQLTADLRRRISQRLGQVALGWFTERAAGEVKQALQDDIGTLHSLSAHYFTTLGRCVGAVGISVLYLFAMDWRLAIVALLPFPLFFLFYARATKASAANMASFGAGMTRINNAVVEFVNGIPEVKAFAVQGQASSSYRTAVNAFAAAFKDFTRPLVSAMANAHALITPVAVLSVVLAGGTLMVLLNWLSPVDVLPFVLVAPGLCAPLLLLSYISHDLGSARAAAERVQRLLHTPLLAQVAPGAGQLPADNRVRFEQVSYAYQDQQWVLKDLSFELKPGSITAVVGSSGSGKSTLARLLLRFFDPQQGRISLGGVDLKQIDSSQLYQRIGFVLQEVRLLHTSLRDNIALGRPAATQEEIEAAARLANIHELIVSLPKGYDSVLGEDVQLSGGELQRVSIARAVLLDPPILVLDEATAAADADNELQIQQALSRFAQGRTVLVIAHRLDTIKHAGQILLLEQGQLIEQGSHHQLLARHGRYAALWQQGGYGQEAGAC